jgi:hypothetical protein
MIHPFLKARSILVLFLMGLFGASAMPMFGATNMIPIAVAGFNSDLVVESTASGPPFTGYAVEFNPGEGNAFYQHGLPGYANGLPANGSFTSAAGDGTVFEFQSYTASNALVLSTATGITNGTLTLLSTATYSEIAVLANSANGAATGGAGLTLNFQDGSNFVTNYYAPDWFNNSNAALYAIALDGVDRIDLADGTLPGASANNPRFYQTTLNLAAMLGGENKPLASISFNKAPGTKNGLAGATAIYAVSGLLAASSPQSAPVITAQPVNVSAFELGSATFSGNVTGNPSPTVQWYRNGSVISGATNLSYTLPATSLADNGALFDFVASNLASNVNHSVTSSVATLTVTPVAKPISLTGFNLDVVVENTAVGPPYTAYASDFNPGEIHAFYQSGLPGTSYGLPVNGQFLSVIDGTSFQFQPYTTNNALVLSGDTGEAFGALTLVTPAIYGSIAILANSGAGGGTPDVTLTFSDGTTYTTTYNAPDWFDNTGFALSGVERISLTDGTTQGQSGGSINDPRFYQTTIDLNALFDSTNKPLASLSFDQASGSGSTGIYAISGLAAPQSPAVIFVQPANQTVTELSPVSFAVSVGGNPAPALQWYEDNVAIPGATNLVYSIASTPLVADGQLFNLVASNVANNVTNKVSTSIVMLHVLPDTNRPVLLGAQTLGLNQLFVSFSELMTFTNATNVANYAITGGSGVAAIISATPDASQSNVVLNVSGLADGGAYTLTPATSSRPIPRPDSSPAPLRPPVSAARACRAASFPC